MNTPDKACEYFKIFVDNHYNFYFEQMREFNTKSYGDYACKNELVQLSIDITHNLGESFSNLKIGPALTSPKRLIDAMRNFKVFLVDKEELINRALSNYDPNDIPVPIVAIDLMRRETIDACDRFLELAKEEMSGNPEWLNNIGTIEAPQFFRLLAKLNISSWLIVLTGVGVLLTLGFYARTFWDHTAGIRGGDCPKIEIPVSSHQVNTRAIENTAQPQSTREFDKEKEYIIVHEKATAFFDGDVLISQSNGYHGILEFTGIIGWATTPNDSKGTYTLSDCYVETGGQVYILRKNNQIWGINILSVRPSGITIQLFPYSQDSKK